MNEFVNRIFDKQIVQLTELSVAVVDGKLNVWLKLTKEKDVYMFDFYNVFSFSLDKLCFPCRVECFQITSNENFGWAKEQKYEVADYKNEIIKFYCEEYNFKAYPLQLD